MDRLVTFDWQMLAVSAVIAAAGLYLGRALLLWLRPKKPSCGSGCGCAAPNPQDQLIPVTPVRPKSPPSSPHGA